MSVPIIPQNPEQALQRQQADAHAATIQPAANPAVELHQLRQAVRDHRDELAGSPRDADSILWAHVPEAT